MHNNHIVVAPIRFYTLALAQGAYFLALEFGTEDVYPLRMVSGEIPGGEGGHSDTEWLPTAKRPRGAEVVKAKI